jgi:CubicO group peptidase (beta-lactamase class C family)
MLAALVFFIASCARDNVGAAAAALSVDGRSVDAVMTRNGFVRRGRSGASVAIAVDGRVVFARGYGDRDAGTPERWDDPANDVYRSGRGSVRRRTPIAADAETVYQAGSVTKTVVAAAIHVLADEGVLSVDDKVSRWLPAFAPRRELTVRHLLEQTSGIPDFNNREHVARLRGKPPGALVDALAAERPAFAAGSRFAYSNSNYLLLGRVVEAASKKPLAVFLSERFFAPLGMVRTRLGDVAPDANVAAGYTLDAHHERIRAYRWDLQWLEGAGGLTTDAPDLARFDAALMDGRVIRRPSFVEMATPSRAPHELGLGAYAHALVVDAIGAHRELWHNGEIGGFHAMHALFPDDRIAIVVLTNQNAAAPEILIGPLLAAVVPVSPLDQAVSANARAFLLVSFACALTGLVAAIGAALWRRRRWWAGALVAAAAAVVGLVLPAFMTQTLAFAVVLVPALLLAAPWRRASNDAERSRR